MKAINKLFYLIGYNSAHNPLSTIISWLIICFIMIMGMINLKI